MGDRNDFLSKKMILGWCLYLTGTQKDQNIGRS